MCSEAHGIDAGAMWRAQQEAKELPPLIQPGDVILYTIGEQTLANGCVVLLVSVRPARTLQQLIAEVFEGGDPKEQEPAKEPAPAEPPAQEPAKDPSEPKPMEVHASDAPSIVPRMSDMRWPSFHLPILRKESIFNLDLAA